MKVINNIKHYVIGWFRYHLYYSSFHGLIRKHIREQIDARINSMNEECYLTGSCIKCGCATTALQMASKSCEGDCYPPLMSKKSWDKLKNFKNTGFYRTEDSLWELTMNSNGLIFKKL